ncbi:MAG: SPFH domain-containing protein [Sulfuricurvum sp.]|nr:SPFH domain-containing protein [Sulfuricurvum sp.]
MSMWDGVKRQLRSVIEWNNPTANELFYRWSENGDEIKNASTLIIGPGQGCIFVYEGKVQAVIQEEGLVTLSTANIPFWTTITKFMQGFDSEHKVGIYFFKKTYILDQKWGTLSPIKYDDPKYKFPVSLMAYGNYSFQISDPKSFFVTIVGGQEHYLVDDFRQMMNARLNESIAHYLANAQLSYAQIDSKRQQISEDLEESLSKEFQTLGFSLIDFRIEGNEFDLDTQERIGKIADVSAGVQGANIAGVSYAELQRLEAMKDAANNQAGAAGMMMGMGVGGALTPNIIQDTMPTAKSPKERLLHLKELFEEELITQDEYNSKKSAILEML